MTVQHDYTVALAWSDAAGTGSFGGYTRDHELIVPYKDVPLAASAPQWFRGDRTRYNSGELLLAAIASSHMARFLEIASQVGLVVVKYADEVVGTARLGSRGDGMVTRVTLRPTLTVQPGVHANAHEVARMHDRAQSMSIIRRSLNIPVDIEPGALTVLGQTA
ncbi:OsmC family protein [Xylanimonas sp. McL0601]|uniref:OsmC family protein n=1 Tax=Xylanimonas sp. McL0601 TaxID=3414739 RepID=UPI003CE9144C